MNTSLTLSLSLLVALLGCASPAPKTAAQAESAAASDGEPGETAADEEHERVASVDRDHKDADGVVRRGHPLTASLEATPVSSVVQNTASFAGKKVKLAGTVSNVCAKRGCWFAVTGDKPDDTIRISTRAKDFYVPHTAVGMKVLVEGTLSLDAGKPVVDVDGLEMRDAG